MHARRNLRSPWLVCKLDSRNAYDLVGGKITIKKKWIKFWIFLCVWRLASVDALRSLIVCDLSLLLESQLLRMALIDVPFVALGTIQGGWTLESLVLFLVAIEAQNMMLRQRR